MIPGPRPKRVRYSIHTPSMPTAATPMISQREGSGARLSAYQKRQAKRQRVSTVSHHGARSACGAATSMSEKMSHARSRAPTARAAGASGGGAGITRSSPRLVVPSERLQRRAAVAAAAAGRDFDAWRAQAVAHAAPLGGEPPPGENGEALLEPAT